MPGRVCYANEQRYVLQSESSSPRFLSSQSFSGPVSIFSSISSFGDLFLKRCGFKSELSGEEERERVEMKPETEERARRDETRVWLM